MLGLTLKALTLMWPMNAKLWKLRTLIFLSVIAGFFHTSNSISVIMYWGEVMIWAFYSLQVATVILSFLSRETYRWQSRVSVSISLSVECVLVWFFRHSGLYIYIYIYILIHRQPRFYPWPQLVVYSLESSTCKGRPHIHIVFVLDEKISYLYM